MREDRGREIEQIGTNDRVNCYVNQILREKGNERGKVKESEREERVTKSDQTERKIEK